jgi:hypothetical protein
VQLHAWRNRGGLWAQTQFRHYGDPEGQQQQSDEGQRRLEEKQHREIEPNAMGLRVAKNIGRPAGGKGKHDQALQVDPRRHEKTTGEAGPCGMIENESVGWFQESTR